MVLMESELGLEKAELERWLTARASSGRPLEPLLGREDVRQLNEEGTLPKATLSSLQDRCFDELCAEPGCTGYADDGEGWEGYCGNHADEYFAESD